VSAENRMAAEPPADGGTHRGKPKLVLFCLAVLLVAGPAFLAWKLWMQRSSLETNAVGALKTYAAAQAIYQKTDWDGDGKFVYADSLGKLAAVGLIDKAFAKARGPKGKPWHGYLFLECQSIGGQPIDWTTDFALCGIPAKYGHTGYRSFVMCTNGTIFPKDQGPAGGFVSDFPADPINAGWWSCDD
jgi:hypothetical protein